MTSRTTSSKRIKILIVDDHPIVRYGIVKFLNGQPGMTVCAEVEDADSAMAAIDRSKPDIAVVDISLKGTDGLALTRTIRTRYPSLPVIILSMHDQAFYGRKAVKAGASGYVMKDQPSETLVDAIRRILSGEICISDEVKSDILRDFADDYAGTDIPIDRLSNRERQVFVLLGSAYTTQQIADKLFLSVKTVETHRARIKEKLGLSSSAALMRCAVKWVEREGILPES